MELPTLETSPEAPHAHTHTVIFLHGRGDRVPNFARALGRWRDSAGRNLPDAFPTFRWVFPQAPTTQCAGAPDMRPQWFDTWDVRDPTQREELQAAGLRAVVPALRGLLAAEAARLGGRWDRLVLAGISMGGATGAHTLFNLDVPAEAGGRLGGFMAFSSRCPFAGRDLAGMREVLGLDGVPGHDDVLRNTPMLLEHCADDPLVAVTTGRTLRDTLQGFGAQVEWKEYPEGGHWFNMPAGLDDVVEFLNQRVIGNSGLPTSESTEIEPTDAK